MAQRYHPRWKAGAALASTPYSQLPNKNDQTGGRNPLVHIIPIGRDYKPVNTKGLLARPPFPTLPISPPPSPDNSEPNSR